MREMLNNLYYLGIEYLQFQLNRLFQYDRQQTEAGWQRFVDFRHDADDGVSYFGVTRYVLTRWRIFFAYN